MLSFPPSPCAASQEAVRALRCQDSPLNSTIGGAATGALLFASHGAAPARGAAICGALGAAGHWAVDQINLERNFRSFLVAWGLLDEAALIKRRKTPTRTPSSAIDPGKSGRGAIIEEAAVGDDDDDKRPGLWQRMRPYFPIKKLTDEEWEEHERKSKLKEERARRAALAGVHPSELPPEEPPHPHS